MSDHREGPAPLAVVDIDGVLADVRHRLHHISDGRRDWGGFFGEMDSDVLLVPGRSAVEDAASEGLEIVYLTGRPEAYRDVTRAWLARHGLPEGTLHMRPDRDRRPARVFKVECLRRLSRRARVAFMLDDDADVVEAVRAAGFPALHAQWLGQDVALHDAQESEGRT